MLEVCAPHGPRIRAVGELTEVVERALEQTAHCRIVKRHSTLSQRDAYLANLLVWICAHCPKAEELRLASEPVGLDVLTRLGHIAAARERGSAVLRHGPLHRAVSGLKQRLGEREDECRVRQAHKRIKVSAPLIKTETAARPHHPRAEIIWVPDAGRRRGEVANVVWTKVVAWWHDLV